MYPNLQIIATGMTPSLVADFLACVLFAILTSIIASPWCYVDMEKCPVQKTKCEAAGGLLGSTISPYCRERESTASFILHHSVDGAFSNRTSVDYPVPYFSYTTCGALDAYQLTHYGEEQIFKEIGGHNLIVSAPKEKYAPWVLREKIDPANLQWGGYTGGA